VAGLGAAPFNALARFVMRPTLRLVVHQPTLRGIFELLARLVFRLCSGVEIQRREIGGVTGLEIRPAGCAGPASLLYLHGGAFTIGSANTHKWLVARIALGAGRVAFVPDYRLAPEHPFPAAVQDAERVFETLAASGPVAVAGDSAGGALALGLCATHAPARAVLLSPVVDLMEVAEEAAGVESGVDFSGEMLLPRTWIRRAVTLYLDGADARDPRASPILHDLSSAPPTLIQAAEGEVLESHARRARAALPDARLSLTPNVAHVWQINAGLMRAADEAVAEIAAFLRAD